MKKLTYSLPALLLTGSILMGALASCGGNEEITTAKESLSNQTETTENYLDTETESATQSTDSEISSSANETEAITERETEEEIALDGEHGALISLSNKLANATDTYPSNKLSSNSVVIQNNNMLLSYNMGDTSKKKLISSLQNTDGSAYLTDTMDVYVRMKSGNTYYASGSIHNASLNIYRLGYYYYENRIEGQSFVSGVEKLTETRVNHLTYDKYNDLADKPVKSEGMLTYSIQTGDPWISYAPSFSAETYDYLEITMKVPENANSSARLFLIAGRYDNYSENQAMTFSVINDGEFHTYQIPISTVSGYTGSVRGLRFDIDGEPGATITISAMKAFKANMGDMPSELRVQRSFLSYSDKLHHILQISASTATESIDAVGVLTQIDADTVNKLVVKDKTGVKDTLEGVDWNNAEYVGFDIKGAGIFGYILPADDKSGSLKVTLADGIYSIVQELTPTGGKILPSEAKTKNANDFFMGQRIYTDATHSFDRFLAEAECERNPLAKENFVIDTSVSDSAGFAGYDALRGYYKFTLSGTDFNQAYYNSPNKHYRVKFTVTGDSHDRQMYFMTYTSSGNLESAVLLDQNDMLLPVPLEVAKNFNGDGENTIYNLDDPAYGEVYFPMPLKANESKTYSVLNLYQNWGTVPLKQISSIQFSIPYYHLSTGVTETNCIVPLPTNGPGLPDHRAMSAPFWKTQPQHNSGGSHNFLRYVNANGISVSSGNQGADIDSYGPTYSEITLQQITSDGKIAATYTHIEMPQTDENRAYYELKYTVLEDVSFKQFRDNFTLYSVTDNNPKGTYKKVGYLDENNVSCVAEASNSSSDVKKYVLGDECPYFSFFDMPDYDPNYTAAEGYTNLSMLILDANFIIGGKSADPSFILINSANYLKLSLDLDEVTLKAGDTFTINAILMPWGSQESDYSGEEPDFNVREVRRNTLLNPLRATADKDCTVMESVFVPKLKTTNGKTAEFTLSGGHNNVAVRIYGFDTLTAPYIEQYVDGEWVEYKVASVNTPDAYGLGHYYDGYMVYYDGDGTYSYSFVTEMDNGAPKKFRISADKAFENWPEEETNIPEMPDPINVYLDPTELLQAAIGHTMIGRATLAEDGSFVRYYGKSGIPESYMNMFNAQDPKFENVTSTGQYFIFKYRMPANVSPLSGFEFFTSTVNSGAVAGDNMVLQKVEQDGEWHVVIIDISKKLSAFKPGANGEYLAKYFRFDFFNGAVSSEMYIDLAYVGLSDSLEDLLALNADMKTVMLVNGNENHIIDTATGKDYIEPGKSYIDADSGYVKSSVTYYATIDMLNGMGSGGATHYLGVVARSGKEILEIKHNNTTIDGGKLVFTGWAIANGGIEKYVWSADGGKTWHDTISYNGGVAGSASGDQLNVFRGVLGDEPMADGTNQKVHFQSGVGAGVNVKGLAADLSAYIGETVNVTFAAVPKAEPDSLCLILHVTNVQVTAN